jgi:hypothetical protein
VRSGVNLNENPRRKSDRASSHLHLVSFSALEPDWTSRWSTYLSANAGAAATLTGLVFIGISINLAKIISSPAITKRAAESIVQFMGAFIVSITLLIPGRTLHAVGEELLFFGLFLWLSQIIFQIGPSLRSISHHDIGHSRLRFLVRVSLGQMATVPFILAGASFLLGHPNGFDWLVLGLLFSFIAGVIGAWVLLVEIIR